MVTAFKMGSAKELAKNFSTSVDISINDNEDTYSKAKAEKVMKDFFNAHQPKSFSIIHQGTSKSGLQYSIGNLETSSGSFRVSFYLKKTNDSHYIQQLRIDSDE